MNILEKIARHKMAEVAAAQSVMPLAAVQNAAVRCRPPLSAAAGIRFHHGYAVMAEFKRKSPSKGDIHAAASIEAVIPGYVAAGAAVISILTDTVFFGGSASDLLQARRWAPSVPLLRKDFIVDAYQIYEARMLGADLVLLIAALLSKEQIGVFIRLAHQLGMEVLLELHYTEDLDKLHDDADLIGINNRNLMNFSVEEQHSRIWRQWLPEGKLLVSESGITDEQMALKHLQAGFDALLVGEAFMKTAQPGKRAAQFIQQLKNSHHAG